MRRGLTSAAGALALVVLLAAAAPMVPRTTALGDLPNTFLPPDSPPDTMPAEGSPAAVGGTPWLAPAATLLAATRVDVTVTVNSANQTGTSQLVSGVTHTQHSLDPWGDPGSVGRGRAILQGLGGLQDQAIMGWGTINPEPAPGQFDFSTLDRRVDLIRSTGGTPVITLCCAPDWMKGGAPGTTDWSRIEVAPTASHYSDFAELTRQVALRYPDVQHYMVWNELKGFWNKSLNRWDYEGYTAMYNAVYSALKSVNPSLQVGGPYIPVLSTHPATTAGHPSALRGDWGVIDQRGLDVVTYWRQHAVGADFVVVDASSATTSGQRPPDEYAATGKFEAVTRWVGLQTGLPVWWAEWYALPADADRVYGAQKSASVLAEGLVRMIAAGSAAALGWQPEGTGGCNACLWTSTAGPGGGQGSPWLTARGRLVRAFPTGTPLFDARASTADVAVLASRSTVAIVNRTARTLRVRVGSQVVTIAPYGVLTVPNR